MAAFDAWAPYYDLIHRGLPGEAEFYVGHAVRTGGPVLELACGTGRLALPMALSGVPVVGVDNARAMLDICQEKAADLAIPPGRIALIEADMAALCLDAQFEFIALAYRGFMHLMSRAEQRACLQGVRERLSADGRFIMNTWIPRAEVVAANSREGHAVFRQAGKYEPPEVEHTLLHYYSVHYDEFGQCLTEEHVLHELADDGTPLRTIPLEMKRRWTTLNELELLLEQCGLEIDAVFGDFDCNPLSPESRESIWVLKKG